MKFSKYLDDYIINNLSDNLSEQMREHIESCEKCRTEYEFAEKITGHLHNMEKIGVSDDFLDKLNKRIDAQNSSDNNIKSNNKLKKFIANRKFLTGIAAAGLFVVIIAQINMPDISRKKSNDFSASPDSVQTKNPQNTPAASPQPTDTNKSSVNIFENIGKPSDDKSKTDESTNKSPLSNFLLNNDSSNNNSPNNSSANSDDTQTKSFGGLNLFNSNSNNNAVNTEEKTNESDSDSPSEESSSKGNPFAALSKQADNAEESEKSEKSDTANTTSAEKTAEPKKNALTEKLTLAPPEPASSENTETEPVSPESASMPKANIMGRSTEAYTAADTATGEETANSGNSASSAKASGSSGGGGGSMIVENLSRYTLSVSDISAARYILMRYSQTSNGSYYTVYRSDLSKIYDALSQKNIDFSISDKSDNNSDTIIIILK